MTQPLENRVLLDFYDIEGLAQVWCWKNLDTGESSKEFLSEEAALEAWRNNELPWDRLEDLGN